MARYIIKRLLLIIPILIGVIFLVYFIMEFTPGDPAIRKLGVEASQEALDQWRHQMGLDKGFLERFVTYVFNVFTKFDFGVSWRTGNPVFQDVLPRVPVTIKLASISILFAAIFGIVGGVFSAVKQYTAADDILRVLSTVLVAMPSFWFAMLLILLFALYLGWLPPSGMETWKHMILPVIVIAGPQGCRILRLTRSTMLESIREDYIRTARAKGVPERAVTYQHALRNAMLPVITTIGSAFATCLGGSVLTENVFAIPGMGSLVVLSIRTVDIPTVLACVIITATFFSLVMLLVDIMYAFIDPRIRAKYARKK
ncbi:MAG: ABC transporter permease [Clostridia bacterium]|nr:ABC transporter permease [Eubacterium sp.]MBR2559610.1 ABC transporter permease [Bacillota bacterium]MBR3212367.1 ABC transporter permease [Bacillota bacterium]MCR4669260.1 ABC transporter permease [Clostridia bacterium]